MVRDVVEALKHVRDTAGVRDDCLLYVCSTDPGELAERLERESLDRLNPPGLVARWALSHQHDG